MLLVRGISYKSHWVTGRGQSLRFFTTMNLLCVVKSRNTQTQNAKLLIVKQVVFFNLVTTGLQRVDTQNVTRNLRRRMIILFIICNGKNYVDANFGLQLKFLDKDCIWDQCAGVLIWGAGASIARGTQNTNEFIEQRTWENYVIRSLMICIYQPNIIRTTKSKSLVWTGHLARIGRWELDNLKRREQPYGYLDWI